MRENRTRVIYDYEILENKESKGKGATANVYKARHLKTKKIVALKEIRQNISQNIASLIQNEIEINKKLKHPYIVRFEGEFRS